MVEKFQNRYRIASARLQNWDYGSNGAYFITICTHNREHYFGEIIEGQIQLSPIGVFAHQFWIEIPIHFPFVKLYAFVVMPNHVHGIIVIDKIDGTPNWVETPESGVSTQLGVSTAAASQKWKPGTLGVIINQYKRIVTINASKLDADYGWQSRYHEHIIRNDESYQRISHYIINNPSNWHEDTFYVD